MKYGTIRGRKAPSDLSISGYFRVECKVCRKRRLCSLLLKKEEMILLPILIYVRGYLKCMGSLLLLV